MANNTLIILLGIVLIGSLALVIAAEKDSSWLKNVLSSEEIAELESKEGGPEDAAAIEKRPSWVSGRDLSNADPYRLI